MKPVELYHPTPPFTLPNHDTNIVIHTLRLDPPDFYPEILQEPTFVYALKGEEGVSLFNTGPYAAKSQLLEKLEEIEIHPGEVQRIVLSNWDVRNLGNLALFFNATTLSLSPDRIKPFNFATVVEHERHRLRSLLQELYVAKELSSAPETEFPMLPDDVAEGEKRLDEFFAQYYKSTPNFLYFAPLKNNDTINLSGATFTVIDHSPYRRGQLLLLNQPSGTLLGLATPALGLPKPFYSLAAIQPMLNRISGFNIKTIATNHNDLETSPSWFLKRTREFMKSFTDNAPLGLRKKPTLTEFVRQNYGFVHHDLIDYLFELVLYQDVLNELARDEDIAISGSGIANRRYGINVLDTRHPRLQN